MTTPEQKREYARRQRNYRRTLCDAPTWKALRPHAEAYELSRAKFSGMVLKHFVAHPHPIDLDSMPEKDWKHSQLGKPRARKQGLAPITGHLKYVPHDEAVAVAEREWIANGANLLHGKNVTRIELKE